MAAIAGYTTVIKLAGTSTAMTDEACTQIVAGPPEVWRITNAAKRIIDPAVAITVYEGGLALSPDELVIDYLAGTITFTGMADFLDVTIDANYLPMWTVADARTFGINTSVAELDSSIFNEPFTKFIGSKLAAEGELEILALLTEDLDTGGSTLTWADVFAGRSHVLLEALVGTEFFRAWARLLSVNREAPQDGVLSTSLSWKSTSRRALDGVEVCWSFI